MKTVALVFTILGMIATLITSTYNFCVYLYANYVTMAILSLVLGVLSVLFGSFAISDLNKNRKRIRKNRKIIGAILPKVRQIFGDLLFF